MSLEVNILNQKIIWGPGTHLRGTLQPMEAEGRLPEESGVLISCWSVLLSHERLPLASFREAHLLRKISRGCPFIAQFGEVFPGES